jgi:hypothetical protein
LASDRTHIHSADNTPLHDLPFLTRDTGSIAIASALESLSDFRKVDRLHAAIHDPAGGFIEIYDSRFTASIPQGESAGKGRINLGFAPRDRTIRKREREDNLDPARRQCHAQSMMK